MLTEDFAELPDGYLVSCYDSTENALRDCRNADEHAAEVERYFEQITLASVEIDQCAADPACVSDLTEADPSPSRYEDPDLVDPPADTLQPLEPPSGVLSLDPPVQLREQHDFILDAAAAQGVSIGISTQLVGSREILYGTTYVVVDSSSTEIARGEIAPGTDGEIAFAARGDGNYLLAINPMMNAFSLTSTNVPLMLYAPDEIHLFVAPTELAFWVADPLDHFSVEFRGASIREGASGILYRPTTGGYEVAATGSTTQYDTTFALSADVAASERDRIWRVGIDEPQANPQNPVLEDVFLRFPAEIGPYLGLTDEPGYFMTVQP